MGIGLVGESWIMSFVFGGMSGLGEIIKDSEVFEVRF